MFHNAIGRYGNTNKTWSWCGAVGASNEAQLVYRRATMPSMDGNTVELNREQVAFAENAVAYSATLSFVQGKVNTITRALKGE